MLDEHDTATVPVSLTVLANTGASTPFGDTFIVITGTCCRRSQAALVPSALADINSAPDAAPVTDRGTA